MAMCLQCASKRECPVDESRHARAAPAEVGANGILDDCSGQGAVECWKPIFRSSVHFLSMEIGRASCRKECRSRWCPDHSKKNGYLLVQIHTVSAATSSELYPKTTSTHCLPGQ